MKGKFKVGVRLLPQRDGARAVQLYLHNFAKVTAVSEGGKPLPILRDHVGDRRASLDDRLYDGSLVVLLDQPLAKGAERRLDLEYEMDVRNFAPGRDWYPSTEGDETILLDTHTARLELTTRKKFEVRAMGRREEGSGGADGKASTSVWIVDHPVKMLTFTYADHFHEEKLTRDGVPDVICFGSKTRLSRGGRFREVGQDVIDSLDFYQKLFDTKLPDEPIYVSSIAAGHGQAFDGFIQLAEKSFDILGPGVGELFRAHEAAHQFWGVLVGAASYRDAWLGEAFAEYSAMMFVEATVKDGPRYLQEIIRAYNDEQNGSIKSGFSKFTRMDVNLANRASRRPHRSDRPRLAGRHRRGADRLRLAGLRQGRPGAPHAARHAARPDRQRSGLPRRPARLHPHLPGQGAVHRRLRGRARPPRPRRLVLVLRRVGGRHGDPHLPLELRPRGVAERRREVRGHPQGPPDRCPRRLQDVRPGRDRVRRTAAPSAAG